MLDFEGKKNEGKLCIAIFSKNGIEYGKSIDKGITMTNNADRVIVIALYQTDFIEQFVFN